MDALRPSGRAEERRSAFEAVALPCMRALFGTAIRLTGREADAADLVQETFLRAFRTFDNFLEGSNAKAWLLRILYSVFVNRYRKEKREPRFVQVEDVDDVLRLAAMPFAPEDAPAAEVEQALCGLPEAFRAAVILVDVEGLSYEEAAAVLACPVGTVRSRLSRARRLLFVALQDFARARGLLREA